MKTIVVVAPHSDDETLGAGGYLLKHKDAGDLIYWINVTNAKKEYGYSEAEIEYWNKTINNVKERIGFTKIYDLGLEPAGLDKLESSKIVRCIKNVIGEIKPNIVLLPYYGDTHSDHRIVFDAVMAACKPFRCPSIEQILCMEIISETDYAVSDKGFIPNYFVDISDYIDEKLEVLNLYSSEIDESPFPRNLDAIKGLAKFRGASCNVHYAEAFRLLNFIER